MTIHEEPGPAEDAADLDSAEIRAPEIDGVEMDGVEMDAAALADRRHRANRATRGGLAAVLCLEAFVVLLVPRTIAQTSTGLSTASTIALIAFAVLLVVTGFLLRRPWGIGLASAMQVVLALTIILVPLIAIVVVIFVSIWLYLLHTRTQLVGTPTGWRMLIS